MDCQVNFNDTPLHYAAVEGHATAVRLLLSRGADRTIMDMDGETAKDIAKDENTKLAFVEEQNKQQQQIHQTSVTVSSHRHLLFTLCHQAWRSSDPGMCPGVGKYQPATRNKKGHVIQGRDQHPSTLFTFIV